MSNTPNSNFGLPADFSGQVRRSPMEMVCDILAVVSEGPTKPTHILYKANMSWKVLSSYLDFLTAKGMVEKEDQEGGKRSLYRLSQKGRQILKLYEGLKDSLNGTITLRVAQELDIMVDGAAQEMVPRAQTSPW